MPGQPVTVVRPPPPGFFGKLPTTGDFVRHNLTGALAPLASRLDERLNEAMDLGRRRHGRAWPARFATAPGWRFALPSADSGVILALAVASRDRVGRPYPLLVLGQMPSGASVAVGPFACDPWFDAAEALTAAATDGKLRPAEFAERLGRLGHPTPDPAFADDLCRRILQEHTGPLEPTAGLWWTFGVKPGQATLQAWPGLPTADRMAGILAGVWETDALRL